MVNSCRGAWPILPSGQDGKTRMTYEMTTLVFMPTIQRPGNCPHCGHWDPFHASWFTSEKEVADPIWVVEWDEELWQLLAYSYPHSGITIAHRDGDWWYHLTKTRRTVERIPVSVLKVGQSPAERVGKTWRQPKTKIMAYRPEGRSD